MEHTTNLFIRKACKLNILIVSPFFPLPLKSGGHTRLFNIIKRLSSRHIVDLISPITEKEKYCISELKEFCRNIISVDIDGIDVKNRRIIGGRNNLRRSFFRIGRLVKGVPLEVSGFYFFELHDKLKELLSVYHYDIIQVELSRMAQYFNKSFYKNNPSLKILVDYDLSFIPHLRRYQCEKTPFAKLIRYIDYRMNRSYALSTWRLFDRFVVMSEVDRNKALEFLPDLSIHVVPNGVDLSYFRLSPREGEENRLLFLGGIRHFANVDALFYFLREIFPRVKELVKDITLMVIGEGWESYSNQMAHDNSIKFTGFVEDIRPYVTTSSVLIAPIRIGGGTRLKILEAFAMGVPVVSTSIGSEGIHVERGHHLLLADSPEEFATEIGEIFSNRELWNKLKENAYRLVEKNYSWDKLTSKMENVYEGITGAQ